MTLYKCSTVFLLIISAFSINTQASSIAQPGPNCLKNPNKPLNSVIECIHHDYEKVQRPNGTDGEKAVRICVDIIIISIGSLNDVEMDYTVEFYMRQKWIDPLLQYSKSSLTNNSKYAIIDQTLIEHLWKPDTYIENIKTVEYNFAVGPFINQGLRLYPNGTVVISSRISAKLSCHMNFKNFPMDKQRCPITLSSYFFTEEDLYYDWGEVYIYKNFDHNNQFDVLGIDHSRSSLNFSSGVFSSLHAAFIFRRRTQNFLLGFYIPAILTVMLSWVSFYISPNSAPARCALGIITVLAIGGFLTGQRNSFPVVSYVMAVDLYILMCYIFTFLALVEYAAVHYFYVYDLQLYQTDKRNNEKSTTNNSFQIDEGELEMAIEDGKSIEEVKLSESTTENRPFNNKIDIAFPNPSQDSTSPNKNDYWKGIKTLLMSPCMAYAAVKRDTLVIDKISRVLFPLSFGLFNVFYWIYYEMQYLNHEV